LLIIDKILNLIEILIFLTAHDSFSSPWKIRRRCSFG